MRAAITIPVRLGLSYAFNAILRWSTRPEIKATELVGPVAILDHCCAGDVDFPVTS